MLTKGHTEGSPEDRLQNTLPIQTKTTNVGTPHVSASYPKMPSKEEDGPNLTLIRMTSLISVNAKSPRAGFSADTHA